MKYWCSYDCLVAEVSSCVSERRQREPLGPSQHQGHRGCWLILSACNPLILLQITTAPSTQLVQSVFIVGEFKKHMLFHPCTWLACHAPRAFSHSGSHTWLNLPHLTHRMHTQRYEIGSLLWSPPPAPESPFLWTTDTHWDFCSLKGIMPYSYIIWPVGRYDKTLNWVVCRVF